MTSRASMQRLATRSASLLASATLGLCGWAWLAGASIGDDAPAPPKPVAPPPVSENGSNPVEAPAAFDDQTNGFEPQQAFEKDRDTFSETENIDVNGLGPVYNATSCVSCHQNPITGGSSQVVEIRAGRRSFDPDDPNPRKVRFEEPPGGSVIQQRAIDPAIQEVVPDEDDVRTFRLSNTILGNGYVEVIPDEEILRVRNEQRRWGMEGFAVVVPVPVEARPGADGKSTEFVRVERIGRFGWKCQEASLLNFASGAYITEMGITNPMQPTELTSNGRDVSAFDKVPDPEDKDVDDDPSRTPRPFGTDVEAFTRFMRSTKAAPRDPAALARLDVIEGEKLFRDNKALGCAVCHHPDYTTPRAGTRILTLDGKPGSDMASVTEALGGKVIHPYSDFLLHDVGTGDGIAQTQHADLPSKGQRSVQKLSDALRIEKTIGRVEAYAETVDRRTLQPDASIDQRTANKVRTAPLWGLRARPQLMHDGLSLTVDDAIRRHGGQAEGVRLSYEALTPDRKKQLLAFLNSL